MWKCCSMRVSRSSAWRLLMPSLRKKSSSGASCPRGTPKCAEASFRISSVVFSRVVIAHILPYRSRELAGDSVPGVVLWQIGQRVSAFHKLAQASLDRRTSEEFAKDFDFAAQLLVRQRFDEPLRRNGCLSVKFGKLHGRSARNSQGAALCRYLAH